MNPREYEVMFRVEDRYWWYRGMRLFARRLLPEVFAAARPLRLLDAGCGTGANLAHALAAGVASGGRHLATGADLSALALRFCRLRGLASLSRAGVTALPFCDGSFDVVTCHDVLYTVPDDGAAVGELARVLAPGGVLYVTVAAFESLRGDHDRAVHGIRRYRRRQLVELLASAGLEVERTTYANALLFVPIWLHRRARALLSPAQAPSEATSDFPYLPRWLDGVLLGVLRAEARLASRLPLPFGVTLVARARKPARAARGPRSPGPS